MPDIQVGDLVRVLAPFNVALPDVYEVTGVNEVTGALQILDGRDFDAVYLEKVS